jgi:hypothetical protein
MHLGGEKLQKNTKILAAALLLTIVVLSFSQYSSVYAENINVPEDVKIIYYSRAQGNIQVPANWPLGGVVTPQLRVVATHIEAGNAGTGDFILIYSYNPTSVISPWVPVAFFTDNANLLTLYRTVWKGTPIASPANSKYVPEDMLLVERHGNDITAELKQQQTIYWPKASTPPPYIQVTIPTFKVELNKIDGSMHDEVTTVLNYAGGSGYTLHEKEMGFNAEGVFTCETWWGTTPHTMTSCIHVMHGIQTYAPP